MKTILVTGGAGFIGSNFVKFMLGKHIDYKIINIDALTYAGNLENLKDISNHNNYIFIKANIDIVKLIIRTLGKPEDLIKYVKDRPGHDRRYAVDNTKIKTQLGWEPAYTFEQGMKETIQWYLDNTEWIENIVSGDYAHYYEKMYSGIDEAAAAR